MSLQSSRMKAGRIHRKDWEVEDLDGSLPASTMSHFSLFVVAVDDTLYQSPRRDCKGRLRHLQVN